jgi:peptide/nickel transport system permease protein
VTFQSVWAQLRRRGNAMTGFIIIVAFLLLALLAPWVSPYDPLAQDLTRRLLPPGLEHWLGTDGLGRDVLSRIIWGSRVSLAVGLLAVGLGAAIGIVLGLLSGFFGGRLDSLVMRVIDIAMAFPTLLLAIAIVAFFGKGLFNLILAIGLSNVPEFARLTRAEALRLRNLDYVASGRALGASSLRLITRHIFPNLLALLIIMATLRVSVAILAESSLSFLQLGLPPPTPSWGVMLSEGQRLLILAPWISIIPGFAIAMLVLGFNLLGDGLRDILDPRTRLDSLTAARKESS